jgi:thioredoxin 1
MENVTKDNFKEKVSQGKVIVDFWAEWCGPCKMLTPILQEIENQMPDVKIIKVNVDEEPELSMEYGIRSIPTVYYYNNGVIIEKKIGLASKDALITMLKQ